MRMPIFFKLWFAFVFFIVLCTFGAVGYITFTVLQAGPEGLGHFLGSIAHGYKETVR